MSRTPASPRRSRTHRCPPGRRPGLLARLILALGGLLLGLLVAEAAVRLGGRDPLVSEQGLLGSQPGRSGCVRPAPELGYELVPGACGANDLGFMDQERVVPKPPGTRRVLALGDSITEQRAWVVLLERMLASRRTEPVEVWNLGVTGYSVLNERALLEERALDFAPDVVLLQLCLNDFGVTPMLFRHQGELYWLRASTGAMDRLGLWLFERSALARLLRLRSAGRQLQGVGDPDQEGRVAEALIGMQALCDAGGVPFEVVLFPTLAPRARWTANEAWTHDRFVALAAEHDIPLTDLTPRMLAGPVDDLRRVRGDAVFAQLDDALGRWGVAPDAAALLRAEDPRVLGLGKNVQPHQQQDFTHPNFLGHYLAAEALLPRVEAALGAP